MAGINLTLHPPIWRPPCDVFETEQAIIIRVEIAGMREGELKIDLSGRRLSIRGNRLEILPFEYEPGSEYSPTEFVSQSTFAITSGRAYHQMEIHFGEFSLDFDLPAEVAAESLITQYKAGFLWFFMHKRAII